MFKTIRKRLKEIESIARYTYRNYYNLPFTVWTISPDTLSIKEFTWQPDYDNCSINNMPDYILIQIYETILHKLKLLPINTNLIFTSKKEAIKKIKKMIENANLP